MIIEFDWWKVVEDNKDSLIRLIEEFHPASRLKSVNDNKSPNFIITAKRAEQACEAVRGEIYQRWGKELPVNIFLSAFTRRDGRKIYNILQETWYGLPESSQVRSLPGFYPLCDLCSEYEGE